MSEVKTAVRVYSNRQPVIGNDGGINLSKAAKARQKSDIMKRAIKLSNQMLKAYDTIVDKKEEKKRINKLIKNSTLARDRDECTKAISEANGTIKKVRIQLEEIVETAKTFGVDIVDDIDKLVMIEE